MKHKKGMQFFSVYNNHHNIQVLHPAVPIASIDHFDLVKISTAAWLEVFKGLFSQTDKHKDTTFHSSFIDGKLFKVLFCHTSSIDDFLTNKGIKVCRIIVTIVSSEMTIDRHLRNS